MAFPTNTKNDLLNGLSISLASLHTDFPGATGANEVSESPYARQSVAIDSAAGGQRVSLTSASFTIPAVTIRWVGFWNGSTFVATAPNGGSTPRNFVAVPSADSVAVANTIYCPAHPWSEDQAVVFYNGTPPGGITEGAIYYLRNATPHTFQVSSSVEGEIVSITSGASFGCVVTAITEAAYATQGVHRLDTATLSVPD